jgi:hypothetical protein
MDEIHNTYLQEQKRMFAVYEELEYENFGIADDSDELIIMDTKVGEFDIEKYISLQNNIHHALKYLYTHTTVNDELNIDAEKLLEIEEPLLKYLVMIKCKIQEQSEN